MNVIVLIVVIVVPPCCLYAQEELEHGGNEELYNNIETDGTIIDEEQLGEFISAPLDINSATLEEMMSIPGMNKQLAEEIITRRNIKPYTSLQEMKTLNGITAELYARFIQCFTVSKRKRSYIKVRERVSRDLQSKEGFHNGNFLGSPYNLQTRFRAQQEIRGVVRSMKTVMLIDKDAGERMRDAHISGYVHTDISSTLSLIAGSYSVQAGEGLVVGYPSVFSRGISSTSLFTLKTEGISPYVSSSNELSFRGIAFQILSPGMSLSLFYSSKLCNGTLDSTMRFSSFDRSGYARTVNELKRQNVLHERLVGGMVRCNIFDGVTLGAVMYTARYNHDLVLSTMIDTTSSLLLYSVFARVRTPYFIATTEYAIDQWKRVAYGSRFLFQPMSWCEFGVAMRHYDEYFQSIHGNSYLSSGTVLCNERGLSFMARGTINNTLSLSMVYDTYFRRDNVWDDQRIGEMIQFDCYTNFLRNSEIHVRWKQQVFDEEKVATDVYGRNIRERSMVKYQRCYLKYAYLPTSKVTMVNRVNVAQFKDKGNTEYGVSITQGIAYHLKSTIRIEIGATVFETDSYDSRLYLYESNLPGYSMTTALYGEGVRWYCVIISKPLNGVTVSCKYSQLAKQGVEYYGSGNDLIRGSVRSNVLVQADFVL
ncbi:MAG: helix-hairpin-helix domain-containing protein [Bacteroidetes bacterium]|nr:helix-hairpin-helix domain-containing protein [Bacteroidota bacterium]